MKQNKKPERTDMKLAEPITSPEVDLKGMHGRLSVVLFPLIGLTVTVLAVVLWA